MSGSSPPNWIPVQKMLHNHGSILGGHVRLECRVTTVPYFDIVVRGRDEGPLDLGSTNPALTVPLRGWWSPQNHHTEFLNHRERAATAATAGEGEPTSGFELDLRYL